MPTIDVQVHACERIHPGRPRVGHLHGPESANGDVMVAAMDAVGVDAAILVSSLNLYRYDRATRSRSMLLILSGFASQRRSTRPIPRSTTWFPNGRRPTATGGKIAVGVAKAALGRRVRKSRGPRRVLMAEAGLGRALDSVESGGAAVSAGASDRCILKVDTGGQAGSTTSSFSHWPESIGKDRMFGEYCSESLDQRQQAMRRG